MTTRAVRRFIFLGGIPVFDYMLSVDMKEIARVTNGKVFTVGNRVLLPVGTVFEVRTAPGDEPTYINPMASTELQHVRDEPYYAMELGGKHPEQGDHLLRGTLEEIFADLHPRHPGTVRDRDDLRVVASSRPAEGIPGGNNKNIIETIRTLLTSPELADRARGVAIEHHFFFDTTNPKYRMIEDLYRGLDVSTGPLEELHVEGLVPRIGYVITIEGEGGKAMDRVILSNRTNEEIIPRERLNRRYFDLQYKLRRDDDFVETHLVVNSMTNHEEIRLVARLLQTAYASGVQSYLCPTRTFINSIDRLIDEKYYAIEKERFYSYRNDFVDTALLPYLQHLVLNRDELILLDNAVGKRGIDASATSLAQRMNRGRKAEALDGGKVVVTGGSKGARYTERLRPERARVFWRKANFPDGKSVRFAERRIVCGDDYVTGLTSTLGAGDTFTGLYVCLTALGWDGGHALRAATLGAQHFIQNRTKPRLEDIVAVDESHIRMGTETELLDVISHHVEESGDPTRYGTIADTVITVSTTQIQHPFREILELEGGPLASGAD